MVMLVQIQYIPVIRHAADHVGVVSGGAVGASTKRAVGKGRHGEEDAELGAEE